MDDLISRQAAISIPLTPKGLRKYHTCNLDDAYNEGWGDYQACVSQLPSAQTEREPAKFIRWMECKKTDKYISYTPHCKCSKCGNELLIEAINYCYMCGAKMEDERCGADEPN